MTLIIFDIEADDLLDKVTKVHCLAYSVYQNGKFVRKGTSTDYQEICNILNSADILVGHNIIRYDIPVLKKILGFQLRTSIKLWDTLALSWYLYPDRLKHGLEFWGDEFGVPKPYIEDWQNLSITDYLNRCTVDVEINSLLWDKQLAYLKAIYSDRGDYERLLGYLSFKMDCAREQEEVRWKVDVSLCENTLNTLKNLRENKVDLLMEAMPKVVQYKVAKKPKILFKKDGNLTEAGKRWYNYLRDYGPSENDIIKVPIGEESGNPASTSQMKSWLFSLGWKPCTFSYVKNKDTGEVRSIPQIYEGGQLTKSVEKLVETNPVLEALQGLTIINHRIAILEGFLRNRDEEDFLKAEIKGLTNTLRFQHTVIVNLPTINKPYGNEIRGALIAPSEDWLLCGSDMSSLEDNTKQHYMFFYDPDYVREMRVPGFSPHLDIGVQGGMITEDESNFYKWYDAHKAKDKVVEELYYPKLTPYYLEMDEEDRGKEFKRIGGIRKDSKQVNFSAVYGVGPPKLSLTTGWSIEKAKNMLELYWKRNWSVKTVAKRTTHKIVDGYMWLWNPVSQLWYSLRYEKDIFSTLNQGKLCSV
jgi:hypothetical protein